MGSTPALCNGQYKTILSKFFKWSSREYFRLKGWNISCRRRNLYLRARKEDSGRFQSGLTWNWTETSLPSNPFLDRGQCGTNLRGCKKIIVFSFDLDSFWLLLSLVTGWFFKGGEARIFEMVSFCEMLSWMISGFSSWAAQIIVPVTTNSFQFRQSLFHSHQALKRPLSTILVIVVVAEAMQKLLKVITLQCCANLVHQRCQSMWYTHIWELIQGWLVWSH